MFSTYAGKWIPDTPGRRQAVIQRLASWNVFSDSSPVEGIEAAIRQLATGSHKISIYVLGDEFTGPSIERVLTTVDRLNARGGRDRRVRIHAIGFPTLFGLGGSDENTTVRFAMLMRALCERDGRHLRGPQQHQPLMAFPQRPEECCTLPLSRRRTRTRSPREEGLMGVLSIVALSAILAGGETPAAPGSPRAGSRRVPARAGHGLEAGRPAGAPSG